MVTAVFVRPVDGVTGIPLIVENGGWRLEGMFTDDQKGDQISTLTQAIMHEGAGNVRFFELPEV